MTSRLALALLLSACQCCACTPRPKPKPLILIPIAPHQPNPADCVDGSFERIRKCRELYWTKRAKR